MTTPTEHRADIEGGPDVWTDEYMAKAEALAAEIREHRRKSYSPEYQARLLLADALLVSRAEREDLLKANAILHKLMDNRESEVATLRKALEEAQKALAMIVSPAAIKTTSVQHAWAQAHEAESRARNLLSQR